MKKLIALLLCLALLLGFSVVAQAKTETEMETQEVEVSLELDPTMETYTLVLPATVELDPFTKEGSLEIGITAANLVWSDGIEIGCKAENAAMLNGDELGSYSYSSYLVNSETNEKIGYFLYNDVGDQMGPLKTSKSVFCTDGYVPCYGNIRFEIPEGQAFPGSGTYSDTLTFTVKTYQN